ncbi:MAG: ABC transporter permease [Lachnospiraceae bacterium]|nr:ABC transporter permease [Lachnospiraceae bacterium]
MKKSAIRKEFYMEIRKTMSRFLSLVLIVALGVAFYSGIRATEPSMNYTLDKMYDDTDFLDVRVLNASGMTDDDINKLNKIECVQEAEGVYYNDFFALTGDEKYTVKLQSLPDNISKLQLVEGRMPKKSNECIVDSYLIDNGKCKVGDSITIDSGTEIPANMIMSETEYKIVGSYKTYYYLQIDRGTTALGSGKISGLVMVDKKNFNLPVYSEVYVTIKDAKEKVLRTKAYKDCIEEAVMEIEKEFDDSYYILDRESIQNYVEYGMDAERIGKIGRVVPVIFFLVAALVSLTTMTRMVEEERTQIGTLKALGYSKWEVAKKYIYYGFFATLIGSVIGAIVGKMVIPYTIINAYKIMYINLENVIAPYDMVYILTAALISVLCVTFATIAACYKELSESAAQLMRPSAPKNGKRVFLEKIGFVWRRMNFTWKSTVRNLVRYKKRFFMTIFGISGSMGLMVLGFGIVDSISSIVDKQYDELRNYDNEFTIKNGLDKETYDNIREKIESDEDVLEITYGYQNTIDAANTKKNLSAYIFVPKDTEDIKEYVVIRDANNKKNLELNDKEVIISKKMSILMDLSCGDTFEIKVSENEKYSVTIGGICENYVYHYIFMSPELYKKTFGKDAYYNEIYVKNVENYDADKFTEKILSINGISGANSVDTLRTKFDDMLQGMDIIILVIIVSSGLLAFVVIYNLNNINISERKRELASLKVLGFYDGEVSAYVFRENLILTIIGIIVGMILGIWIHKYVISTVEVDLVMFGRNIKMLSFLYSSILTMLFSLFINGLMHFKLKKIDIATSMKSVE